MRTDPTRSHAAQAALAQPLTEELLARSGVLPGMRVLVLGNSLADLALLVAERVGPHGSVIGVNADAAIVAEARRRAADECFAWVSFRQESLEQADLAMPLDAVVGRFFLMYERDPVEAIARAAALLTDGGRIVFQEWQYDSILREETSDWPYVPLYRQFARWSLEALRLRNARVDIGLRLVNAFTEAGLDVPAIRTSLRAVHGGDLLGYSFFEDEMRELLPTIELCGIASASDVDVDTFADRMERETRAAEGHVFLPLQVGAWTRV
ncbi:MAG TPA: methyltransferase domain-containing protein [Candidatus Cybelea sp.]|jgi:SAM-dependent methyltransferase|nr:methyltransferase domain-containing protein [Candidatus Cybelea sp.]